MVGLISNAVLASVRGAATTEAVYVYREMRRNGVYQTRRRALALLERERAAGNLVRTEDPHGNRGYGWLLTEDGIAALAKHTGG